MSIEEQLSEADIQALYDDYIREMQEGDSKNKLRTVRPPPDSGRYLGKVSLVIYEWQIACRRNV